MESNFDGNQMPGGLGLGCWAFGGTDWPGQTGRDTESAMEAAWEAGITHWDTAIAYGSGASEIRCGQFLNRRRQSAFLATKGSAGKRPDGLVRSLHRSLANLQTEYVDLFYIHFPKTGIDMRPHMALLEKEREKGTIRSIGVSNFSVDQMKQVSEAGRIDVCQCAYNFLWREPERDLIPYCLKNEIEIVTHSSLALGILTGKFFRRPQFPLTDVRSKAVYFHAGVWPCVETACIALRSLAVRASRPMHHLALQWLAQRPGVKSILFGARDRNQVEANVGALEDGIDSTVTAEMTAISDEADRYLPRESNIFQWYP